MSTINLGELVKGLMVVVGIALSMGKLPELKRWAAKEAFGPTQTHVLVRYQPTRLLIPKYKQPRPLPETHRHDSNK